jgi:esterase/lipase superfamily enzyme
VALVYLAFRQTSLLGVTKRVFDSRAQLGRAGCKSIFPAPFRSLLVALALLLGACQSSIPKGAIDLMPAPDIYADGTIDHLIPEESPFLNLPYNGILYATDRARNDPVSIAEGKQAYLNKRGHVLRLGVGNISTTDAEIDWEEARRISLLKNRDKSYPIAVDGVEEYGVLNSTITPLMDGRIATDSNPEGQQRFAAVINQQLRLSKGPDVYVYVHGYKVDFNNPLLVATELWHFLGYSGAFVAYSWPSTPKTLAYLRDIDTAAGSARNFRLFLEFLAEHTDARRIHVIGYSAGTRLVTRSFEQMAIASQSLPADDAGDKYRIGNLILVGSDVDRSVFGEYLADGLLSIPQQTSVYMSDQDKALGVTRFLTRSPRLGQLWEPEDLPAHTRRYLEQESRLSLINVSAAAGANMGNGHSYFRSSPWVSSDVLIQLAFDLPPQQRGLLREADSPLWYFPDDYTARLRELLNH